jgi:hypothetical protein
MKTPLDTGDARGRANQEPTSDRAFALAASALALTMLSRGLGGFSGLLLGSVSQQCAHHAACPVVIVRAPTEKSV